MLQAFSISKSDEGPSKQRFGLLRPIMKTGDFAEIEKYV